MALTVLATDSRAPVGRRRLALRTLVYLPLVIVMGAATFGLGWLLAFAPMVGRRRQTAYDEWSQTIVVRVS